MTILFGQPVDFALNKINFEITVKALLSVTAQCAGVECHDACKVDV